MGCSSNSGMDDKNYIITEIEINENKVNEKIRIINSFEETQRNEESNEEEKEIDLEKLKNEEEIQKCIIKINNIIIPFSYFHKFSEKRKYAIQYIFYKPLTKTDYLFNDCKDLTSIDLSHFNTNYVINMRKMFHQCEAEKIDLSGINTQNVTDMSSMLFSCVNLTNLNLSKFNTKKVINLSSMFSFCQNLTSLDLSNFNTENVKDMCYMFCECKSLKTLKISKFNTKKVINLSGMFSACESLDSLDLSHFNTQNATKMGEMFKYNGNLKYLNISNFSSKNVENMYRMFYHCFSLEKQNLVAKDHKFYEQLDEDKEDDANYIIIAE